MLYRFTKDKIRSTFEEDGTKRGYFIMYTIAFIVVSLAVYSWVLFTGHSLILLGDGSDQHYTALKYYGLYLRNILKALVKEKRLVIPDWDFYIGEGSDIMTVLGYYVIGDPLALISMFVPERYTHYLYTFLCILRSYLAGVSFSLLAFGTGKKSRYAVMAGSISYIFCSWTLMAGIHPFFLNPMIYFPLIILGIENILKGKKPWLFTIMVSVAAASNLYFFYIISVLAVIYTAVRLVLLYGRDIKQLFCRVMHIGVFALIGVSISGAFLLPVLMALLQDTRMSAGQIFHLLYPLDYYKALPGALVSPAGNYYLFISMTVPALLAFMILFVKKNTSVLLRVLSLICLVIMLFPIFGRILNGMSYMANRWSWAFDLLAAYILVDQWDDLIDLPQKIYKKVIVLSVCFYAVVMAVNLSRTAASASSMVLMSLSIVLMIAIRSDGKRGMKQMIQVFICCINVMGFGFWHYSPFGDNAYEGLVLNDEVMELSQDKIYEMIDDGDEYKRITGKSIRDNSNILHGISSTQYYWSMSNPYMNHYRDSTEMPESLPYNYSGYDMRTAPLALSGVNYYISPVSLTADRPYGFGFYNEEKIGENGDDYVVLENNYALPLGYCYDSYTDPGIYESLDPVSRQQLQLDAVYLGDHMPVYVEKAGTAADDMMMHHKATIEGAVTEMPDGGMIVNTSEDNETIRLIFEGEQGAETYVRFSGLEYECTDDLLNYPRSVFISFSDSNGVEKFLNHRTADYPGSSGRSNYVVNMGYSDEPVNEVLISFRQKGKYTVRNVDVYTVSMAQYENRINRLRSNALDNISMDTDRISGTVALDKPAIMVISVPYSHGWKAYVDGVITDVFPGNERHLAIELQPGAHLIDLQYKNPYKKAGFMLSLAGLLSLILAYRMNKKKCA